MSHHLAGALLIDAVRRCFESLAATSQRTLLLVKLSYRCASTCAFARLCISKCFYAHVQTSTRVDRHRRSQMGEDTRVGAAAHGCALPRAFRRVFTRLRVSTPVFACICVALCAHARLYASACSSTCLRVIFRDRARLHTILCGLVWR